MTADRMAPPVIGGHLVGFRLQISDAVTKQQDQLVGVFHLIEGDGWKVKGAVLAIIAGAAALGASLRSRPKNKPSSS